jgi:hypothetical protein
MDFLYFFTAGPFSTAQGKLAHASIPEQFLEKGAFVFKKEYRQR